MISHIAALIYDVIATKEDAMPLKPRYKVKAKGIPLEENYTERDGKIVKRDTAPPHVRAGRRRKRDKVTGARAAK